MSPFFQAPHLDRLAKWKSPRQTDRRCLLFRRAEPAIHVTAVPLTQYDRNVLRTSQHFKPWEGTPMSVFTRAFAVTSTAGALIFLLAITLGFLSPSSRQVGASPATDDGQTIAQRN
jgi:hypothetical protein